MHGPPTTSLRHVSKPVFGCTPAGGGGSRREAAAHGSFQEYGAIMIPNGRALVTVGTPQIDRKSYI